MQYDGAQPLAVLHFPPVAEQIQDLCRTRAHFKYRLPVFTWRYVHSYHKEI